MLLSQEANILKISLNPMFIPVMSYVPLFYVFVLTNVIVSLSAYSILYGGKYFRRKSTQNGEKNDSE